MTLLLSIRPKYVEKIFSGTKTFELRRRMTQKYVEKMLIYRTSDVKEVVGVAKIQNIHFLPLDQLWELVGNNCGVDRRDFDEYYKGLENGYAIEMTKIKKFKDSKKLEKYGIRRPPQSFMFVNEAI